MCNKDTTFLLSFHVVAGIVKRLNDAAFWGDKYSRHVLSMKLYDATTNGRISRKPIHRQGQGRNINSQITYRRTSSHVGKHPELTTVSLYHCNAIAFVRTTLNRRKAQLPHI